MIVLDGNIVSVSNATHCARRAESVTEEFDSQMSLPMRKYSLTYNLSKSGLNLIADS